MDLSMAVAVIGCVIAVLSFFFGRKNESGQEQYKMGVIDTKLNEISKQLQALSDKLDRFDKDTDERIKQAILQHEKIYHGRGE